MEMNGYVKNITSEWAYAMKRSVRPGGEILLKELFEQYGKKHGMSFNKQFINWLKEVKLPDRHIWAIVHGEDVEKSIADIPVEPESRSQGGSNVPPMVSKDVTVEDITGLSVRKAREALPKINNLSLLRYALKEANQLAGKDSLCKLLYKRVRELQISR